MTKESAAVSDTLQEQYINEKYKRHLEKSTDCSWQVE